MGNQTNNNTDLTYPLIWSILLDYKEKHEKQKFFSLAGVYQSNFDVRYSAQKSQSCNWVLKLNLHIYFCLLVCLYFFCLITKLLEFSCRTGFSNQNEEVSIWKSKAVLI